MKHKRRAFLSPLQVLGGGGFSAVESRLASGARRGAQWTRGRNARRFRRLGGEWLEPRTLLTGTASIAGTIWNDADGDGSRGANEAVLSGVTVYLDLNDNKALDGGEPTKVTAADGSYSFTNLDAGNYVVREQTPNNFQITSPQVAGRRLFVLSGSSSTVYEIDGITGFPINSFAGPTSSNGPYGIAFDGQTLYFMAHGNHTLYKLNPNTGAVSGSTVIPGTNFDASIAVRQGKVYMLNRSGSGSISIFDPVTNTVTGSLPFQGGVYYGLQDSLGDSPATNEFLIAAYHQIDFLDATTAIQTHSFEVYGFDVNGVEAIGNEIFVNHANSGIEVYSRAGTLLRTLHPPVSLGESAGYADMSGCYRISLPAGFPATNVNFGDQSVFGSIHGTRWQDVNANGVRDRNFDRDEVTLPGRTMYLDLNDNGSLDQGEPTTLTQSDGSYAFANLAAGSYVVRALVTAGYSQTYPLNSKNRLFVSSYVPTPSKIYELDPNTGVVINSFNAPFNGYADLAFDGKALYTISVDDTLYKIDPDTGAVIASASLPGGTYVGLAAENGELYSYPIGDSFTVINPQSMQVIGTLPTSSNSETLWSVGQMTNPDRIMGLDTDSQVVTYDTTTGAQSIGFTVAGTASVIYASGSGSKFYASDDNGHINVYSTPSGALLQTLNFAPNVDGLVYLAGTGGAQRITLAPGQIATGADFGMAEPSLINQPPMLDEIGDPVTVAKDGLATVNLSGVSAGPFETQTLTITATSSNPAVVPNPTVNYTSPQTIGSLTITPAAGQIGAATITVTVKDNGGTLNFGSDTFARTFSVIVNDAPVLDPTPTPTLPTLLEDPGPPAGPVGSLVSSLVSFATPVAGVGNVTDVDSGAMLGMAVTAIDPNLSCYYSLNGGSTWNAFGATTASAQLIAADSDNRIYCQPNSNVNGTFANALTFRAWDETTGTDGGIANTTTSGGGTAFSTAKDGVSLTVTAVNDPPTATNLNTSETYTEDTAKNLVHIVVSDVDNTTVTVTLTVSNVSVGTLNTATSGAVTSTYDAGSGVWTASGPIANVNTLLAGLTFTPVADFNGNFTIATSVSDGIAAAVTGSKTMTGSPVNDAPILDATKSPTLTVNEDPGSPSGAVGNLVATLVDFATPPGQVDNVTDIDAGALLGIAITAVDPQLTCYYSLNGGTSWNSLGTVSATSSRLLAADSDNRLYCQPGLNLNGTFTSAVTFRAWDRSSGSDGGTVNTSTNGGTTPYSTVTDGISLIVTAVNDAPTATNASAGESYTEDTPLNLIDMVVSDVDSTLVIVTLTLSNTAAGSLSTDTSNAVTSTYNAGTGVWTASGAIADVNVLLAGVVFTPSLNFNSNFTITGNFSDGSAASSGSKTMTGIPVNDAPTATNLSAAETYTEDTSLNLTDIVVSDVDSSTVTVTLTLSNPTAGSLTTGTVASTTSTYNATLGIWTALGPIANVNALLAGVIFNPALNFNSDFNILTSVSDGVAAPVTGSKAMTGTAVNDAPTATNLNAAESYTEDTGLNLIDIVVSDVDSSTVTATLTLSNTSVGSLSTDTSNAVTSTYNAGTGIWTASGALADVNILLAGVVFNPSSNFNGTLSIATNVSDGVAAAISGSKTLTGIGVDDAPTASNLNTAEAYTEDTALNLTDIVVSDMDSTVVTATLTLSLPTAGTLSTGTSGAVTSTYNAATGVWTASGLIADVNTLLAGVTFNPALNFNGNFAILTSIGSSPTALVTGSKAMTGTAVNDAPTATNLNASESYTEDTALNLIDIVVSDVDSTTVTAKLTLSIPGAGSLSTATAGATTSTYDPATGVWSASGLITEVNALLAGVTFNPSLNFNGNLAIATSLSDGIAADVTGSKAMTGLAVNDAPTATNLNAAETYTEDTALNLIDIVVSDLDSASVTVKLTLSNAAAGSLSTSTTGAVTSTYNAGTGIWTASGAIADVNTLLANVTLTPAFNFNGNFAIATSVSDGVAAEITGSKAMNGTAVNDAPTATNLSAGETYTEDTPLNLIDLVVSDVDSTTTTVKLTLSSSAAGSLGTGTSGAVTSTYNAGTGVWTASGPITDVNSLLAGLIFTPALNYNANFTIATSISDGIATPVTGSKAMTGAGVNDAPVLDSTKNPILGTISEDPGPPSGAVGVLVSSLVDFAIPAGQMDNVTDVDSGAILGVAVTAVDPNLSCFYLLTGGGSWNAIGAVTAASARLLAADNDNRIYCQPGANVNGTIASAITFRAWDRTSGADGGVGNTSSSGGTTAFSSVTDTASMVITPVNDAPVRTAATASLASVLKDSTDPVGDSVLNLFGGVFHDADGTTISAGGVALIANAATAAEGTWQYSVSAGPFTDVPALMDSTAVILLSSGDLIRFLPAANYSGTPGALTVRLWDGTGGFSSSESAQDVSASIGGSGALADNANEITLTTAVILLNYPPSFDPFTSVSHAADENKDGGPALQKTELGWVKNINPGAPSESGQQLTFKVTNDNTNLFVGQPAIDSQGNLTYTPRPNVHGTATVTVTLKDDGGGDDTSASRQFDIVITKTHRLHNSADTGDRIGLDVTGSTGFQPDEKIVANDVLTVINYINAKKPTPITDDVPDGPPFVDVVPDDHIAANDVIAIINYINSHPGKSEGEADAISQVAAESAPNDLINLLSLDIAEQAARRRRLS